MYCWLPSVTHPARLPIHVTSHSSRYSIGITVSVSCVSCCPRVYNPCKLSWSSNGWQLPSEVGNCPACTIMFLITFLKWYAVGLLFQPPNFWGFWPNQQYNGPFNPAIYTHCIVVYIGRSDSRSSQFGR